MSNVVDQIESRKESTVKDFLEVIFRRKWIIIGIVSVATVIVFIVNMREPAIYESAAKVLVKRGEQPGVFTRQTHPMTWEEEIASQIEMVKSKIVIDRAQEKLADYFPSGYESAARLHSGRVGAGVVSTSNVLWIAYTSSDPVFCEAAVNAIINAYKAYYHEVRTPPEMEDFFSREINAMGEELEYWRERKERVEREWGIVNIRQQQIEMLENRERYRVELEKVSQELSEKKTIVAHLNELRLNGSEEFNAVTSGFLSAGTRESALEKVRKQIMDLRVKESELSLKYTGEHLELRQVREQIDKLSRMLESEIEAMLYIHNAQIAVLEAKQSYNRGMIERFEQERKAFPEKEVEIERINSTLIHLQENYDKLVEQHMASRITTASNPEWTITILDPASPGYQQKTRDYVRIALGPLFSIIVALGFAFFLDNLDHSIKNVAEAEETLKLHVLASFPESRRR